MTALSKGVDKSGSDSESKRRVDLKALAEASLLERQISSELPNGIKDSGANLASHGSTENIKIVDANLNQGHAINQISKANIELVNSMNSLKTSVDQLNKKMKLEALYKKIQELEKKFNSHIGEKSCSGCSSHAVNQIGSVEVNSNHLKDQSDSTNKKMMSSASDSGASEFSLFEDLSYELKSIVTLQIKMRSSMHRPHLMNC